MSYVLTICYPAVQAASTQKFAAELALKLDCPLRLLHAYTIPYVVGEFPVPAIAPDDQRQIAARQLETATQELRTDFPALRLEAALEYGIPADLLEDAVEKEAPLVIVLGNDESDRGEAWIGTDTATMMAELSAPVLVLSSTSPASRMSSMCLALDHDTIKSGVALNGLEQLQRRLGFSLTVVTILKEQDEEVPAAGALGQQLDETGAKLIALRDSGEALSEQLIRFAETAGADCLAVVRHERGFWGELFHRSNTGEILRHVKLPVLAFHAFSA